MTSATRPATLTVPIGGIDPVATLAPVAIFADDPTVRLGADRFVRATLTPDGAASVDVTWDRAAGVAQVRCDGPGAAWLLGTVPGLLGCEDDVSGFDLPDPRLRDLWRRHRGDRIGRTRTVWHDLAWIVVQQRVARLDAGRQWRRLVEAVGEPAPGPIGLRVPPSPAALARLTWSDFHGLGIDRQRAEALTNAARVARQLQALADGPVDAALPALLTVRGIGPWTASCLSAFTWGHPDTVIVGDVGIPSMITWMLAGEERGDDARMLELLEPYRPHRYRILKLAFAARMHPPRRHPRGRRTDIRGR